MSIASSASSQRSCTFQGAEMTVDQALDQVIRDTQQALNGLQQKLRQLCSSEDQQVDDVEDFKECVGLEDDTCDLVDDIVQLLNELPNISSDIRGSCPADAREWWTKHKAERKLELAALKARRQQQAKDDKETMRLSKLSMKQAK